MSIKIEISQEYFIKHLHKELEVLYEKVAMVDDSLYSNDKEQKNWQIIRDVLLKLDELKDAIAPF